MACSPYFPEDETLWEVELRFIYLFVLKNVLRKADMASDHVVLLMCFMGRGHGSVNIMASQTLQMTLSKISVHFLKF